uniref:Uncharacterized protein n=1 Tax=Guillardia theta TaxID=55529 RepID=A0A7S4JJ02_GUITH|mmetsp:Transcript_16791/g.55786  ORF Transcript_16791/g.55786 Transcript_16791/m.55786 type:complete len:293 (+) Transcript_16791:127-1005(+)
MQGGSLTNHPTVMKDDIAPQQDAQSLIKHIKSDRGSQSSKTSQFAPEKSEGQVVDGKAARLKFSARFAPSKQSLLDPSHAHRPQRAQQQRHHNERNKRRGSRLLNVLFDVRLEHRETLRNLLPIQKEEERERILKQLKDLHYDLKFYVNELALWNGDKYDTWSTFRRSQVCNDIEQVQQSFLDFVEEYSPSLQQILDPLTPRDRLHGLLLTNKGFEIRNTLMKYTRITNPDYQATAALANRIPKSETGRKRFVGKVEELQECLKKAVSNLNEACGINENGSRRSLLKVLFRR